MFAVIQIDNKSYKVQKGDLITIEKTNLSIGDQIIHDKISLLYINEETLIGKPYLNDWSVTSEVVESIVNKKVTIFKQRRRKNSRRTQGHRQKLTLLSIKSINNK